MLQSPKILGQSFSSESLDCSCCSTCTCSCCGCKIDNSKAFITAVNDQSAQTEKIVSREVSIGTEQKNEDGLVISVVEENINGMNENIENKTLLRECLDSTSVHNRQVADETIEKVYLTDILSFVCESEIRERRLIEREWENLLSLNELGILNVYMREFTKREDNKLLHEMMLSAGDYLKGEKTSDNDPLQMNRNILDKMRELHNYLQSEIHANMRFTNDLDFNGDSGMMTLWSTYRHVQQLIAISKVSALHSCVCKFSEVYTIISSAEVNYFKLRQHLAQVEVEKLIVKLQFEEIQKRNDIIEEHACFFADLATELSCRYSSALKKRGVESTLDFRCSDLRCLAVLENSSELTKRVNELEILLNIAKKNELYLKEKLALLITTPSGLVSELPVQQKLQTNFENIPVHLRFSRAHAAAVQLVEQKRKNIIE